MEAPSLAPHTEELLVAYRWPGNVREIRNVAERIAVRHVEGVIWPTMLPAEMRDAAPPVSPRTDPATGVAIAHHPAADAAWNETVSNGQDFWAAVHSPFIKRDLTKSDVREIVKRGLKRTQGSYRDLIELFHLPPSDYKRFLAFLYQHDSHLPFHPFRDPSAE